MPIPNAHRILVIGTGVGGICVAGGLQRDGHGVTFFERRLICGPVVEGYATDRIAGVEPVGNAIQILIEQVRVDMSVIDALAMRCS